MNEWKELKIDNLPSDIFTGDYEIMWEYMDENESFKGVVPEKILSLMRRKTCAVLMYRKRQPKAPTHEEIMTRWWRLGSTWHSVIKYKVYDYYISGMYVQREFFKDLKSADIPPEAE